MIIRMTPVVCSPILRTCEDAIPGETLSRRSGLLAMWLAVLCLVIGAFGHLVYLLIAAALSLGATTLLLLGRIVRLSNRIAEADRPVEALLTDPGNS